MGRGVVRVLLDARIVDDFRRGREIPVDSKGDLRVWLCPVVEPGPVGVGVLRIGSCRCKE